ncbi:MAG: hypothetical protein JW797_06315 [Bradymonadales bacterium]|nr:hypothetical protein [Bradymonadales bacterium]
MKKTKAIAIALTVVLTQIALLSTVWAQSSTRQLLGLVPDGAILAGHIQIERLLENDRLDTLLQGLHTALGDSASELIDRTRQEFDRAIAPFANHVQECVLYSESYENNAPVTICRGEFGPSGWTPPTYTHVEVVADHFLFTGSRRAAAIAGLQAERQGTARVGDVEIDPTLLAHLVVVVNPDYARRLNTPGDVGQSIDRIEVRLSQDASELGSIKLDVVFSTSTAETAQQLKQTLQALVIGIFQNEEALADAQPTAEQLQSWFLQEGTALRFSPDTQSLATIAAAILPIILPRGPEAPQIQLTTPAEHSASPASTAPAEEGSGESRPHRAPFRRNRK